MFLLYLFRWVAINIHMLSKKDLKRTISILEESFRCVIQENIRKPKKGYVVKAKDLALYILETTPSIIETSEAIIPTIHILNTARCDIGYVTIDEGAEPHILNGADIMIPGIVDLNSFREGDIIGVKSVKHGSYIAIGKALMDSERIKELNRGKAVKNIHYAGDKIWRFIIDSLKRIQ